MSVCCLILILLPLSCMGGDVTQTVFSNIADDVMFVECLINSMTARSKLDCARRCSSDPNCKTFTFTKGSPTGTCRLHPHVMTSQSPRSAAPGARSYTVKTEEVSCGVDADGWTVFQRRQDGSMDFYRGWTDYVNGFGNSTGECWLGLETLHTMTSSGNWTLRIDLGDWEGNTAYATYTGFYITGCADNYRLMFDLGSYSGDAGDSLYDHRDMPFTTHDADHTTCNCAVSYHGAWWFRCCYRAHLNGEYMTSSTASHWMGVNWYHWRGDYYSLKFSEMKLKRV